MLSAIYLDQRPVLLAGLLLLSLAWTATAQNEVTTTAVPVEAESQVVSEAEVPAQTSPEDGLSRFQVEVLRDAIVIAVVFLRWYRRQRPHRTFAEAAVQARSWDLVLYGITLGGGVLLSRLLSWESIGPYRYQSFGEPLAVGLVAVVVGVGLLVYSRIAWVVTLAISIASFPGLAGRPLPFWALDPWWVLLSHGIWAAVSLWALLQKSIRCRVWSPAIEWSSPGFQFRIVGVGLACIGGFLFWVGTYIAWDSSSTTTTVLGMFFAISLDLALAALGIYRSTKWGWLLTVVTLSFLLVLTVFVVPQAISENSLLPMVALCVVFTLALFVLLRKGGREWVWSRQHIAVQEAQQKAIGILEEELRTAHDMQMALMPKESPQIAGFEICGRCIPASHVGGDLFQYFHQKDKLFIGLADVTGHAMAAAIPVVMFSGVLRSQVGMGGTVEELFGKLNQALYGALTKHTLVCLAMGELDPASRRFRFSNAGCPYPYHYRSATGDIAELQVDAYPLGARPNTTYRAIDIQLEPGDRLVFCSDGIIEAANVDEEMFGFERTSETIRRGCAMDLSAEALLGWITQEAKAFRGEVSQGDDQTVIVLKVSDRKNP